MLCPICKKYHFINKLDEIIFCDNSITAQTEFNIQQHLYPKASFLLRDAILAIKEIEQIDIFFYRKDSNGEGGSSIYFYGDNIFPLIVEKLNPKGALIISDGSNARGANWRKIKRKNGAVRYNRQFKPTDEQQYLTLRGNGPVYKIMVLPVTAS